MFNIGPGELIVIALVLLIAVGPEQLPGRIRRIGSAVGQVRGMTDSLRSEFMSGLDEIERAADPNAWAASAGPSENSPKLKPGAKPAPEPTDESGADGSENPAGADGSEQQTSQPGNAAWKDDPTRAARVAGSMRRSAEPAADPASMERDVPVDHRSKNGDAVAPGDAAPRDTPASDGKPSDTAASGDAVPSDTAASDRVPSDGEEESWSEERA